MPHSIKAVAKLCVRPITARETRVTALFGVAIEDLIAPEMVEDELWECEITIKPIRKWRMDERKTFVGHGISGMLTGGYEQTELWNKKPYYDSGEIHPFKD